MVVFLYDPQYQMSLFLKLIGKNAIECLNHGQWSISRSAASLTTFTHFTFRAAEVACLVC